MKMKLVFSRTKGQEQEDFRKKEMKWQDIACNNKHLFWEL